MTMWFWHMQYTLIVHIVLGVGSQFLPLNSQHLGVWWHGRCNMWVYGWTCTLDALVDGCWWMLMACGHLGTKLQTQPGRPWWVMSCNWFTMQRSVSDNFGHLVTSFRVEREGDAWTAFLNMIDLINCWTLPGTATYTLKPKTPNHLGTTILFQNVSHTL